MTAVWRRTVISSEAQSGDVHLVSDRRYKATARRFAAASNNIACRSSYNALLGAVVPSAPVSVATPHNYKLIFCVADGHVRAVPLNRAPPHRQPDQPPLSSARLTLNDVENHLCCKFVSIMIFVSVIGVQNLVSVAEPALNILNCSWNLKKNKIPYTSKDC